MFVTATNELDGPRWIINWKKLPIPDVSEKKQKPIVELAGRILAARKQDPAADISDMEQQIDAMVAKLYGVQRKT